MPATKQHGPVRQFDDAEIMFPNFRGLGPPDRKFNTPGDRNFNVVVPTELVDEFLNEGWNVKCLKPLEEGLAPKCIIEVAVEYRKGKPPHVVVMNSRGKTRMNEETVSSLDYATISRADLIIRGNYWDVQGRQGMKAYLQSLYVTVYEDPLQLRYEETPSSLFEGEEDTPPFTPDPPY